MLLISLQSNSDYSFKIKPFTNEEQDKIYSFKSHDSGKHTLKRAMTKGCTIQIKIC